MEKDRHIHYIAITIRKEKEETKKRKGDKHMTLTVHSAHDEVVQRIKHTHAHTHMYTHTFTHN